MGALVAAVNKAGENVVPRVATMLKELTHRGRDAHGIATPHSATAAQSIENLAIKNCSSSVALGHNLSRILPRDQPQPVQSHNFTVVFEGRLFPFPELPEIEEILRKLAPNPIKNASQIIESLEGSYAFAVATSNKIVVGRDVFGTTPLYYGENNAICAVASERKALWKVGIQDAKPFPPGYLAVINAHGFSFKQIKALRRPPKETVDMETATKALQLLLLEGTRKRVSDIEEVAVAFSGGVDSSVIAVLAKSVGVNVQLISVGLEDQPEVEFAEKAAEALGLPLHLQTYTVNDLKETLAKVLWLIEEHHTVKASIAIPFFWTAETASKLGCPILFAGQGADELFGGYQKYLTEYDTSGTEAVDEAMYHDIENSFNANFQRDNQVCSFHGIELRLPYVDRDVIDFTLRLPIRLQIASTEDRLRKRVLRQVAHNLEIPTFIADKPKKAIQYTTGVTKALQRLAKEKELTLREYVKKTFSTVYRNAQ
ncbi:MAG: asparagine synthetase B [Candidatus Bathyarchaeum sp.]|nr:MAG: asparagine synthetase B [Candidatus Bathyarchaeum sp.]